MKMTIVLAIVMLKGHANDVWSGRYVCYDCTLNMAIRLTKSKAEFAITGVRRDSIGGQRIAGTFDSVANSIRGKFLFTPQGGSTFRNRFSTFAGAWDMRRQCFVITEDQGDAHITYYFRRESRKPSAVSVL